MSRELFEEAYRRFWDHLEAQTPRNSLLSYDLCKSLGEANWRIGFISFMVEGELRESINLLNTWMRHLAELEAWSATLSNYSEDDAWSLRIHFVEPAVYYCMLQPSSTRDRLGQVATNGIHQANLQTVTPYKDVLKQDSLKPGRFLGRSKTEDQLDEVARHWSAHDRLLQALRSLDCEAHRDQTIDYRNRASHFIAPRLELGEVQIVTRSIVPSTKLVKQDDGTYRQVEIPGEKSVSYGFGGIRPLTLDEIIDSNSRQLRFAKEALEAYSEILRKALATMDAQSLKV